MKQQGLLGLETVSSDCSKNQLTVLLSSDRSVCITSMASARKLSFLEIRSRQQGDGGNGYFS